MGATVQGVDVTTTKKKTSRKKATKKTSKKKAASNSVDISAMAKDFEIQTFDQLMEEPLYSVPFRNHAIQAITGGLDAGTVNEIAGDSQSGKSFLLYELMAEALKMGGYVKLDDIERAFRPAFGRKVGLTGPHFAYSKEKKMERVFGSSRKFIETIRKKDKNCPIVVGVDSYPPMVFGDMAKEIEKADGKDLKGYLQAKKNALLSQFLGEFTTFCEEHNAIFVLVNQGRRKMGVMFGDDRTTNGEGVIQFYCTTRLWGKVGSKIKEGEKKVIGRTSHWETIKNRKVAPFKKCTVDVNYKSGVDPLSGFGKLLIEQGIAKKVTKVKESVGVSYQGKKRRVESLIQKNRSDLFTQIRGEA